MMQSIVNEDIYWAMRQLLRCYAAPAEAKKYLAYLEQIECDGYFPPGKWFLHTFDALLAGRALALTDEDKRLYQTICTYCI